MNRALHDHALAMLRDTLAPLASQFDDPAVQEVMVNRADDVWVEANGALRRHSVGVSEAQIRTAGQVLGAISNKDVSNRGREAIMDGRLENMRVAAALRPVSIHGASICIRKHPRRALTLSDYLAQGALAPVAGSSESGEDVSRPDAAQVRKGGPALEQLIRWAVRARKNIIVAGGTSTGKTTFLNALLSEIPSGERVITIEDTPELQVRRKNFVSFESNEQIQVSTRDPVKLALRYRPDRIIVGEVRGGEAFDLLQALSTGHDGGVGTLHANDANGALTRLEQLVLQSGIDWPFQAIRHQIATTFHFIIQLSRLSGARCIFEVVKILGYSGGSYQTAELFRASRSATGV